MGNKYPIMVSVETQVNLSQDNICAALSAILVQKYAIPIGDFDMDVYRVDGKRVIGAIAVDEYGTDLVVTTECHRSIYIISSNENAVTLYESMIILEEDT